MHIYNYLICAIAQVILVAIAWQSAYMDTRRNKLFCLGIVCNILTLLGYAARGVFNDGNHLEMNVGTNLIIYLSATLLTYMMLLTSIKKNGMIYKFVTFFEAIIIILICSSPWTKLLFYVDENGIYQRGRFSILFFIQHGIFVVLWIVLLGIKYRHVEMSKKIYVFLMGFFEVLAIILQFYSSDFKVIYVAAAFILGMYYAFMLEVEGRYDQMTGVYSKRFFYSEMDRLSDDNSYIVFMLDANGLKYINDNMGHEYGDIVIKSVGQAAWSVLHTKAKIFRTGGDEFVGFSTVMKELEMKKCIEDIDAKLKVESEKLGFDVATSIGYAIHILGEDFQSTLHRADEYMYKVKAEYYERTGKKRRV